MNSLNSEGNENLENAIDSPVKSHSSRAISPTPNKLATDPTLEQLRNKRKLCSLIEGPDSIENYTYLNKIHEGVYGIVFRAQDKVSEEIYAIKKVKLSKDHKEGFPITTIREINLLMSLNHPNIISIREVVLGSANDKIYVVMEYMEHELKDLMERTAYNFSMGEVKCLVKQLLEGLDALHSKSIMHRDLKPSNLLYSNSGQLKIGDFGLARRHLSVGTAYTPMVVTLWYRAPEILLGNDKYTTALDIWSAGCIFAELILKEPLLRGKNEIEQINKTFSMLGTPTNECWPYWNDLKYARNVNFKRYPPGELDKLFPPSVISPLGLSLMKEMLAYDQSKRITASKALKHPWFKENPPPQSIEIMPTFPSSNEMPRDHIKSVN